MQEPTKTRNTIFTRHTLKKRRIPLLLACVSAFIFLACTESNQEDHSRRPNIVLVNLDTLRPDHLAPYGYPSNTAPFIEEIAEDSAIFLRAHGTSSWTAPTSASIFTGLYPTHHGVIESLHAARIRTKEKKKNALLLTQILEEIRTLPEALKAAGYTTFGIGANPNIGPEIGFSRGFDYFKRLDFGFTEYGQAVIHDYAHGEDAADALLEWKDEIKKSSPSFIYLHLNDAHTPYNEREPWFEAPGGADDNIRKKAAYDSEISYLDKVLARLYRELDWDKNTLFILVSDHGEAWGEHGYYRHPLELHRELTRVLLIASAPDLGIERKLIADRVSQVDVLPTILDMVGAPVPAGLDGQSLKPLIFAGEKTAETKRQLENRKLFAHTGRLEPFEEHRWSVSDSRWKLIQGMGEVELFDLKNDPYERKNVARQHPRIVAELRKELRPHKARIADLREKRVEIELDNQAVEQLKALGYGD